MTLKDNFPLDVNNNIIEMAFFVMMQCLAMCKVEYLQVLIHLPSVGVVSQRVWSTS